jgi:hypothetical protein
MACETCRSPGQIRFMADGRVLGQERGRPWQDVGRWEIIDGAAVRFWSPGAFEAVWLIERQGDRILLADADNPTPEVYRYSE